MKEQNQMSYIWNLSFFCKMLGKGRESDLSVEIGITKFPGSLNPCNVAEVTGTVHVIVHI